MVRSAFLATSIFLCASACVDISTGPINSGLGAGGSEAASWSLYPDHDLVMVAGDSAVLDLVRPASGPPAIWQSSASNVQLSDTTNFTFMTAFHSLATARAGDPGISQIAVAADGKTFQRMARVIAATEIASVFITTRDLRVKPGASLGVKAIAVDTRANAIDSPVQFSVSDTTVARLRRLQLITWTTDIIGVRPGKILLRARLGSKTDSVEVVVE